MSTIEKIGVLSFFELKLLIRKRNRTAGVLCLPILGGIIFGLAGRGTAESLAPTLGAFLVMLTSTFFLAVEPGLSVRMADLIPSDQGEPLRRELMIRASWVLAAFPILAVQAALYTGLTAILGARPTLGLGILGAAVAVSLILGLITCRHR